MTTNDDLRGPIIRGLLKMLGVMLAVFLLIGGTFYGIAWYIAEHPAGVPTLDRAVNQEMKQVEKAVAADQVKQYDIAKRSGDRMQTCVQAGTVKAAFLQAKDEDNYKKWMAVEKADCAAAGMPRD